ncbi:PAS domain-containing sensor histidine kinase [Ilyomonas limi]|uniref:histidine kinase n=1 Tax=Ilyomonas limi TaxID=2575867 RepID=A0A4U3KX20_9BACT|nr:PAS domain-containing sensor histidine kinase [Ilyomonas limi]TKK66942.1 PAS domain-containing sensor histidine kinase [Ilyomonas limi]
MNEPLSFDVSLLLGEHSNLTDDVIFAFQPQENKLLFLSAAFEKVWNMPREAVDSDLSLLINTVHPDDRLFIINAFTAIQQTKQKQRIEVRLMLTDQQEKWIGVNAYLTQYNGINTIIGTATDITAYKEYGNILYKFANKKNAILDILSHDLVSPIGNIQACARLLLKHAGPDGDEIVNKMLNIITENSERSIKMIRDLVNKEVLESSEVPLIMQRTDIIQRIAEVIEQYKRSYHTIKQQIAMVSNVNSLYINVDETKFMQVINNLLSNALKFTRDTDEIKVIVEDGEAAVLLKVVDTGVGIPADMQPFIFDKFTKARRPGIHGEPTTGLGLSIIKTIVEWHKGHIWFESAEEKGTTFFVQIPKNNQ